jgi:nicotinamide riboside kinase
MIKRLALVGASSTGKTTVYELLKNQLPKWEFVNESTRTVARYGFPINELGTTETQLAISSFHLEALLKPYNLILDRCYLDLVVYSRHMPGLSQSGLEYIEDTWKRVQDEYTHYIYFPIEFQAIDDGERSVDEDWRKIIDQEFKYQLDQTDRHYLAVTGSPMQRINQILKYIK